MGSSSTAGTFDAHEARRLLGIATDAASLASQLVSTHAPARLTLKGDRDITSDVDFLVEKSVREYLRHQTPDIAFLGEEEGHEKLPEGACWILDPIDGTINYVHGLPLCAVSLSLVTDARACVSVISLPFLGTQYTALRGHGSFVGGQRLAVSTTTKLHDALVSIDQSTFADDTGYKNRIRMRLTERLTSEVQRVRVLGTSAIDLAWTAHGRLDACVLLGNKPWDTSAGVLIAQEAGARVLDQDGADHSTQSWATIAVTPALEYQVMDIVRATLQDSATTTP